MKPLHVQVYSNPLFSEIEPKDIEQLLSCLEGRVKNYLKGEFPLLAGDPVTTVGLVLSGNVHIFRETADGKQNLIAELKDGDLFGEVFACAAIPFSPVTVKAVEPSAVLEINYEKIITTCPTACIFHNRLIKNMLCLMARKNLHLNQKIELLSKRTIRERLLLYFDQHRQGACCFILPFNREELAAYLCVDRSALSAELSRMQRDGLIVYKGNRIEFPQ